jgi:hypothetical protein
LVFDGLAFYSHQSIVGNKLGNAGAMALAQGLACNSGLESLFLSGMCFCLFFLSLRFLHGKLENDIGIEGFDALAAALMQNHTLKRLTLVGTVSSLSFSFFVSHYRTNKQTILAPAATLQRSSNLCWHATAARLLRPSCSTAPPPPPS